MNGKSNTTIVITLQVLRGKTRVAQNINVTMRYVEKENGDVVDSTRAAAMRKFAHSIWVAVGKNGTVPPT